MSKPQVRMVKYFHYSPRIFIFFTFLFVYTLFAVDRIKSASPNNHFAYQAEAFLAGQTNLVRSPPHGNDWASYELITLHKAAQERASQTLGKSVKILKGIYLPKMKKQTRQPHLFQTLQGDRLSLPPQDIKSRKRQYFVSFPPLPAILILPFVFLFGLAASDVWLTLVFAALNAVIAFELFLSILRGQQNNQPLQTENSPIEKALWLTASLCLGTAHFWCAVRGEVWFTALIIGMSFQLLFFKWAWHLKSPFLAGLAYAAAFSTRASLITLGLFAYAQLFSSQAHNELKERVKKLVIFTIPPLMIGLVLLCYNYARFEEFHEFGHRYLAGGQLKRITQYGLFHWIFFKKNLIAAFALLPLLSSSFPLFTYSWHGMAIQFSSPQLLWSFFPSSPDSIAVKEGQSSTSSLRLKNNFYFLSKENRVLHLALYFVLLSTFLLLMFYQNTGWVQYSWRFIIDMLPCLFLLFILTKCRLSSWYKLATCWAIMINLLGALVFGRYSEWWLGVNLPNLLPH